MEHLKMQSPDIVSENMTYIAERWPECLTEAKDENGKLRQVIDFDKLRQVLSADATGEGQERYQFTWPDKRHAIRLANTPTTSTLRPCRADSVDFDNTQNLYIEGDNLDVLKLLRESYLGKVKMIYIDPPYNTGGDFVYKDNFVKKNSDYTEVSGAYDEEGNQVVEEFEKNIDSNGRFHTDWLNMIYPRLKVARDLLSEDGVIFISIDDNEVHNLRKVCNEVFGEKNFIDSYVWESTFRPDNSSPLKRSNAESVLFFAKDKQNIHRLYGTIEQSEGLPSLTKNSMKVSTLRFKAGVVKTFLPNGIYPAGDKESGYTLHNDVEVKDGEIITDFTISGRVIWGQEYLDKELEKGTEIIIKSKTFVLYSKKKNTTSAPNTIIPKDKVGDVLQGRSEVVSLFQSAVFSYPKPISLVRYFAEILNDPDSLILDFFSGSATTAHAVMQLNADDGGKRKYICVQLPEATPEGSEAYKAGYKTICEIGKERIRRAGKKIKEEHPDWKGDTGFRVLKLESSNMENVYYTPAETTELTLFADNIKPDRTDEDLLFQVMMELGIALSDKIEKTVTAGKTVWNVGQGYLMACFERDVTEDTITAIAKQQPQYFVMADRSLASDNVADNFEQLFEEYSPDTQRRIL